MSPLLGVFTATGALVGGGPTTSAEPSPLPPQHHGNRSVCTPSDRLFNINTFLSPSYNLCLCFCVSDSDEDTSEKSTDEDHQRSALEELTDLHFKFEIKEVCLLVWPQVIGDSEGLSLALAKSIILVHVSQRCVVCSGAVGANPAGGPGEDHPVLKRL